MSLFNMYCIHVAHYQLPRRNVENMPDWNLFYPYGQGKLLMT